MLVAGDFETWRAQARALLAEGIAPHQVDWAVPASDQTPLPLDDADGVRANGPVPADRDTDEDARPRADRAPPRVPRAFLEIASLAGCHRSPRKWHRLYRLLWRIAREGSLLLDVDTDTDVQAVKTMAAEVRRDEHKMRAFVRFTAVADGDGERYVAVYEPDHVIVRRAAPFFADRFSSMRWSILTPDLAAHWDGAALSFTEGVTLPSTPGDEPIEELWRVYYAAVFNPARLNLRATLREMPLKRWRRLPEAALIPGLVSSAHEQTARALATRAPGSARPFVPDTTDLRALRDAAGHCRGCRLHAHATQTVFGSGPAEARVMLIGEQPGDAEDLAGEPFVGPAGEVLDNALAAAAIPRAAVYLTNAVKHFSFEPRGKRRIHQTPRMSEMRACRPWLEAEIHAVRPDTIVCLGATAARAILGPQARVMTLRGRAIHGQAWAPRIVVTVHPSAVLRSGDEGAKYFAMLVADLTLAVTPPTTSAPPAHVPA